MLPRQTAVVNKLWTIEFKICLPLQHLSVATTVDFDSSSYVKGQQLKGFMGFFSDVDNTSSASLSAYVEPALEAEDAALSSKLGIGLKDLGYSGF